MADHGKILQEKLEKNLKASEYHEVMTGGLITAEELFRFWLSFIHKVINSGRFKGSKLLELGSGATVHGIASASAHFQNIVQSDYVTDNIEELKKWHEGKSTLDWSGFLKIVAELEGCNDTDDAVRLLEKRIRKTVKCIVKTDILCDAVLSLDELKDEETKPPYDLIIACLCLEAAAPDFEEYVKALARANKLLRPGGGLITIGFQNGAYWGVGNNEYHYLKLTTSEILNALAIAGFGKPCLEELPKLDKDIEYEYENIFAIAVEKVR